MMKEADCAFVIDKIQMLNFGLENLERQLKHSFGCQPQLINFIQIFVAQLNDGRVFGG